MGMEPQSTLSGFLFKRTEQVVFLYDRKCSAIQKQAYRFSSSSKVGSLKMLSFT